MDTQNKQWVCHPALDHSGQLGPEDLSSNNRTLQSQPNINDDDNKLTNNNEQQLSDIQNKNGLDQFFVQQVEDAICENSQQTILRILDEVTRLTSIEKLLLYLKLPTDMNNITDPLRQPLNPLGSRTEISQTIMWIRTHLEEDPELSLPKQEVYNEYTLHCANNKMKPLSTADFGKVMKQVYPSVRPRRLGTRGNSRYCYAGLRKRFKLEVPELPELGDRPQSTEALCTQNELTTAACTIICEWAESILGTRFQSVFILASYLVRNAPQNVSLNSAAAAILVDYPEGIQNKDSLSQELLPYSNHVNLKHKEAQLNLHRKLHQREFKRKLQLQSPKAEPKSKIKKSKLQGGTPTRTLSLDSADIESPKSQGYQLNIVCDKATNETLSTLPDFSSFHQKKPVTETEITIKKDSVVDKIKPSTSNQVSRSNSLENEIYDTPPPIEEVQDIKPNFVGKLPIPRLPIKMKTMLSPHKSVILQAPKKVPRGFKYKAIQPKPAKNQDASQGNETGIDIQIAPDDSLKNADYLTRERLISVSQVDKDALDDYLHGGSNSQEQEEELMQYFKNNSNNNNSNNNNNNEGFNTNIQTNISSNPVDHDELSNGSKNDKLSQLRLLLEQNFNQNIGSMSAPQTPSEPIQSSKNIMGLNINTAGPSAFTKSDKSNYNSSLAHSHHSHINSGVKRRVSFETSIMENDTVPPSPNTRRKNFSFTPISPGPHSPGGGRQSKCNSTNASPFVSPRNTPVPRAKLTHVQSQAPASFVAQTTNRKHTNIIKPTLKPVLKHQLELCSETDKIFSDMIEEKHFVNPTDIMPKCSLPMSAPPSPMIPYKQQKTNNNSNLLQKLLDSNSKVSYMPDYEKSQNNVGRAPDSLSQEVSQLLNSSAQNLNPIENSYRSQSVPLHQMTSFKTLMSPCMPNTQQTHFNFNFTSANNSLAPTPVPAEFSDFETINDINTGLNNENLNQILNILETTQANQIDETASAQPLSASAQPPLSATVPDSTQTGQETVFNFEASATEILNQASNNRIQSNEMIAVQKLIRSQSIDIDMELRGMAVPKYNQPSRSVPSTPLPYSKSKLQLDLNLNNNQSENMPENIFNDSFLLNGPVKLSNNDGTCVDMSHNQQFPTSLGFIMHEPMANDNKMNFSRNNIENYGARRNLNTLLEQQLEEDYSPAVPRVNSGS